MKAIAIRANVDPKRPTRLKAIYFGDASRPLPPEETEAGVRIAEKMFTLGEWDGHDTLYVLAPLTDSARALTTLQQIRSAHAELWWAGGDIIEPVRPAATPTNAVLRRVPQRQPDGTTVWHDFTEQHAAVYRLVNTRAPLRHADLDPTTDALLRRMVGEGLCRVEGFGLATQYSPTHAALDFAREHRRLMWVGERGGLDLIEFWAARLGRVTRRTQEVQP